MTVGYGDVHADADSNKVAKIHRTYNILRMSLPMRGRGRPQGCREGSTSTRFLEIEQITIYQDMPIQTQERTHTCFKFTLKIVLDH